MPVDAKVIYIYLINTIATLEYILNMTPEHWKELDINASMLWYIQKNLRDGKKIKLYDKVKAKMV